MIRTKSQNSRLYGLFSQLAVSEDIKKELVFQFTGGRTEKSSEMEHRECNDLINTLQQQLNDQNKQKRQIADMLQKQRRNIFKLMYDVGLINNTMKSYEKVNVINNWISKKTKLNKELNSLNYDELISLKKQLQAVRRNYNEAQVKQAKYN